MRFAKEDTAGTRPRRVHAFSGQVNAPVSPFVQALCPAPPVDTPTRSRLPCRSHARLSPASTQATLPHCGVSITRLIRPGTGYHPGCHNGSRVNVSRHLMCHVARRCYPSKPWLYVRRSRSAILSTMPLPHDDFRRQK